MKFPDLSFEALQWKKGNTVIGIDEVGRGAFAGPVAVGGVVFPSDLDVQEIEYLLSLGINDSKKLTAKKREELSFHIKALVQSWHISFISVETINEVGIGEATFLGMKEVVSVLSPFVKNPFLLVDAFEIPDSGLPQQGIVRGDSLSLSIASASIIAKVERDQLMRELSTLHPHYSWEKNKGYGTLDHRRAIVEHGITKLHREVFCRKIRAHLLF